MNSRWQTVRYVARVLLLLTAIQIGAASALAQSQPASASPTPQASPTPSLEKRFFKNILQDQRTIWTSPLRVSRHDTKWLLPLGLSTGALIATDPNTARALNDNPNRLRVSRDISNLGSGYTTAGIAGTFYLFGRATHNARARETGLLGGEALIDTGIVALVLKNVTQRPRPRAKDGRGDFFEGGRSFPSGHAIAAWSLATVVAEEYRNHPLVRFSAYGLAAAASGPRYTRRNQFLSHVLG